MFEKRNITIIVSSVLMSFAILFMSHTAFGAWCDIDWDGDGVVEDEDYLANNPIRGFFAEFYIYRYYSTHYNMLFPSADPTRLDFNKDGMVDDDDLIGVLNPAADTEGFYIEWYIYQFYPSYYPIFFVEPAPCDDVCTLDIQCGPGHFCLRTAPFDGNPCDDEGRCEPIPATPICFMFEYPVCGCDGLQYSQACNATAAGITIAYHGECKQSCETNADCAADEACLSATHECGGDKFCEPRPIDCSEETIEPVCGCDSVTYNNECEARQNGANVLIDGPCECSTNDQCEWPKGYCKTPDYDCSGQGLCAPRSETCLTAAREDQASICTCQGFTRLNPEEAIAYGMSIKSAGTCPMIDCNPWYSPGCPEGSECKELEPNVIYQCHEIAGYVCEMDDVACTDNSQCQADEYCDKGGFDSCDNEGVCRVRHAAESCSTSPYDTPVCGCNGNSYTNQCLAEANGTNVWITGEDCRPTCSDSSQCAQGQFCQYPKRSCSYDGRCEEKPEGCYADYAPVCGCDGNEYGNQCEAWSQGISVLAEGRCPCASDGDCDTANGEVCLFQPSLCSGEGTCSVPATDCSGQPIAKVCGCNGTTYDNECTANAVGISVVSAGVCCEANTDCDANEYCHFVDGSCGETGVCETKPTTCPTVNDPVVGCDSVTYNNGSCAAAEGVSLAATPNLELAAGYKHTCVIKNDGSVDCWGEDHTGSTIAPPGPFLQISSTFQHTCGLKANGTVDCWGDNYYGQCDSPGGTFIQVIAGATRSCGLRSTGIIECWGEWGFDQPGDGPYIQFSSAGSWPCGMREDGTVECDRHSSSVALPTPYGVFTTIRSNGSTACGIRSDSTIECWGSEAVGRADAPAGVYSQLSMGNYHACAVKANGDGVCWGGSNSEGQLDIPPGSYRHVDAGYYHSCGIKTDGTVVCWGRNTSGQSTPPYDL